MRATATKKASASAWRIRREPEVVTELRIERAGSGGYIRAQ